MEIKTFKYMGEISRADVVVSEELEMTRSNVARLIEEGNVLKDGKEIKKNTKIEKGAEILVKIPDAVPLDVEAEDIPLDIIYEDSDLLVVNKPKGMVVHPAAGNPDGTLVNALLSHCGDSLSGINGVMRPGILHRIDKNTSGLLMVAKNDNSHNFLAEQIKSHSFTRVYHAMVYGTPKENEADIVAPIARHPKERKKMAVVAGGREAKTHYRVIENFGEFSYVELRLFTGRTHQIRVHMAYIGHPVAGDDVYGPRKVIKSLGGQCLHAKKLGFIHPKTKEYMEFDSELPEYFKSFLETLKQKQEATND